MEVRMGLILFACILFLSLVTALNEPLIARTKNGPIQGIVQESRNPGVKYVSFLGLRYADPPARFEPAKPLTETWSIPKKANSPGKFCFQPGPKGGEGSDDCLFLNVHVPLSALKDPSKRLPVMFWIHGGGLTFGEGSSYGAKLLMENEQVILVTTNYRLGVFGFIATEKDNVFTANNGHRDLIQALKWTQENIAAFHGNPSQVTIFGESAGSASVHFLLLTPLAKGLFHGAIMQSGALSFLTYQTDPTKHAINYARHLNCPNTEDMREIKKCLSSKSGDELRTSQLEYSGYWPEEASLLTQFVSTSKEPQENAFYSSDPSSFYTRIGKAPEYHSKVPVILGFTEDEGSNLFAGWLNEHQDKLELLFSNWTQIAPRTLFFAQFVPEDKQDQVSNRIREYYWKDKPFTKTDMDTLTKVYSDALFTWSLVQAAKDMARSGMTVYPFIYSLVSPNCLFKSIGYPCIPGMVGHADELHNLFDFCGLFEGFKVKWTEEDIQFSKNFVKLWTGFGRTGKPNISEWSKDKETWKSVTVDKDGNVNMEFLEINHNLKRRSGKEFLHRTQFWMDLLREMWTGETKDRSEL